MSKEFNNSVATTGAEVEHEEGARHIVADALNAFVNDPSRLSQFGTYLVDAIQKKLGWSDADVNPKTFNEMNDEELLAHLSEFLGSGAVNTTINGAMIETAQEMADLALLTDDELAELDNSSDPRVTAAKLRKAAVEAAQDAADREHERMMEERRAEWDAEMHDFGGKKYTGAQITQIYKWLDKKENQEKIRQQMKADGKTDAEINDAFEKVKQRELLWEKMRDATAEERKNLQAQYDALGTKNVKDLEYHAAVASGVDQDYKNINKLSAGMTRPGLTDQQIDETFEKVRQRQMLEQEMRDARTDADRQGLQAQYDASESKNVKSVETTLNSRASAADTYVDATGNDGFKSARDKNIGGNFAVAANGNTPVATPAPAVVAAVAPSVNKIDNSFAMM